MPSRNCGLFFISEHLLYKRICVGKPTEFHDNGRPRLLAGGSDNLFDKTQQLFDRIPAVSFSFRLQPCIFTIGQKVGTNARFISSAAAACRRLGGQTRIRKLERTTRQCNPRTCIRVYKSVFQGPWLRFKTLDPKLDLLLFTSAI